MSTAIRHRSINRSQRLALVLDHALGNALVLSHDLRKRLAVSDRLADVLAAQLG